MVGELQQIGDMTVPNLELKAPNRSGRVTIIVNAKVKQEGRFIATSPVTERMVAALKAAIVDHAPDTIIETLAVASLWSEEARQQMALAGRIYCPLTIQLPPWFAFPHQAVYSACEAVQNCRQWVTQVLGRATLEHPQGLGDCWLPIIWTPHGPFFAEVITEGAIPNAYQQPLRLPSPLYQNAQTLASELLEHFQAPPAVYLLQFALAHQDILFDRLWPFPAAPAIASLHSPHPNLFTYHWYCLTGQPVAMFAALQSANK